MRKALPQQVRAASAVLAMNEQDLVRRSDENFKRYNERLAVIARREANTLRKEAFRKLHADAMLNPGQLAWWRFSAGEGIFAPRASYFSPSWTVRAREAFYRI